MNAFAIAFAIHSSLVPNPFPLGFGLEGKGAVHAAYVNSYGKFTLASGFSTRVGSARLWTGLATGYNTPIFVGVAYKNLVLIPPTKHTPTAIVLTLKMPTVR